MRAAVLLALFAAACAAPAPDGPHELDWAQDFAAPAALGELVFSDPAAWRWSDAGGVPSVELVGGSDYAPPHRSPLSVALVEGLEVGDFVLDLELLSTGREYGHRDLCLFFGYESPRRFYYVHLATTPDAHAGNVFLVDGADRRALLPVSARGVDWGQRWHRVRVERRLGDGAIRVFFDDLETPVLEGNDATIARGRVGFGSFDDSGRFARVRLTSPDAVLLREPPPAFGGG